ncbi:MAG: hypothetical protein KBC73_10065 [Burkholderiaceae bacterium]|nr:hypothetical protein [Burkholderiaceae bacterium]
MPAPNTLLVPPRLQPLAALALMLEKLEREPHAQRPASALQYQTMVQRLQLLLAEAEDAAPAAVRADEGTDGVGLQALLGAFPALAELYENRQYAQAGLCRQALEPALRAELEASALLRRLRRPPSLPSAAD